MNDSDLQDAAIHAVHQLIHRAVKAEHELEQILQAYKTMDHGERVSLDNLCAPLNTALIRAEGAYSATNPRQTTDRD
jgi:hypothetical protein